MKEAEYYHYEDGNRIVCDLCPHHCNLKEGRRGICGSRVYLEGKLYSEVYGHPCAIAVDPIEKKPLIGFHPGSTCLSLACTGCNFRCKNCQNHDISQALPPDVRTETMSPIDILRLYKQLSVDDKQLLSIAYTYTEPLTYIEYVRDIAKLAHAEGIYNVLVSAGFVNRKPLEDIIPYLDAANIDLKSFSEDIYKQVSGGKLKPVLDTILALHHAGVWVEITNLLIPTINDDLNMFKRMCQWLMSNGLMNQPLHITRFFPAYQLKNLYPTPIRTMREARKIALEEGLTNVHLGNI